MHIITKRTLSVLKFIAQAYIVFLLVHILGGTLCAGRVQVLTTFDKRTVDLDDEINMVIKVIGSSGNLQRPRLPAFDAFETFYTGRSSHFDFVDGESVHTLEFKYVLVPQRPGTFTVGPFEIMVDTVIYRTQPISVQVLTLSGKAVRTKPYKPVSTPPASPQPFTVSPPPQQMQQPEPATLSKGSDKNLFVTVTADKKQVYTHEQITLTYTIFTKLSIRYEGYEEEPEMLGFWIEELPEKKHLARQEVFIKGERYAKADIRKIAIFPTRVGEHTIKPGTIQCTVKVTQPQRRSSKSFFDDNFFGSSVLTRREKRLLETEPLIISVIPFPEENKPEVFTGLSGDYRFTVGIDKERAKVNEPVTLTMNVEGVGNVNTIERPRIAKTDDFQVLDSDSSITISKETGVVHGSKTFKVVFLPKRAGALSIPEVTFSYFNLRYKKYMTLRDGPFQLNVLRDTEAESLQQRSRVQVPEELKEEVTLETKDVRYIKGELRQAVAERRTINVSLLVLNGIVAALLIVLFLIERRRKTLDRDIVLKRKRLALKTVRKKMRRLKRLAAGHDIQFFELSANAFSEYIADKCNLAAQSLTWETIEAELTARAFDRETIAKCRHFYDTCNFARFASSTIPPAQFGTIRTLMREIIHIIERKIT